jgi:3-isopropylmalate dehydrogenase
MQEISSPILGAMIQGGMGIAAGGNIHPEGVSMLEPIGGSAPKYTGQGIINPVAAIGVSQLMLETPGENRASGLIETAVTKVLKSDIKDVGAGRMGMSTSEVGDRICEYIDKLHP